METIAVTGAWGKAGRAVVADLLAHGYQVRATDLVGRAGPDAVEVLGTPLMLADLTDHGQTVEVLEGVDAVIHLGNIPSDGRYPDARTLDVNVAANHHMFLAAKTLGLRKVVWASSETTLGLPFDVPPRYAPVDEAHFPVPNSTYALSKVLGEQAAELISGWSGIPFVGLRLSNIHTVEDYAAVPGYQDDAQKRRWNLWGYVDVRDVALACRLGLERETSGSHNVIIAAADTIMARPSADLMAEVFPDVPLTRELVGNETLLGIDAARDLIGYAPEHSWRDHV
ncbi:NAD(P)-dependent oxidoreductase [Actinotalea sp. M2MS4P-6]|uniref:NAD-dependent epimerase/dehydratase family protein n=1 Tax=Actinotalea sp. M2MS4P-6 TaxID=2983762 RepID=UPI0021E395AB|nr:NAD(P)-dependent oxidoreductase [Actinotalea sp. M2MS4P-6]MCV2393216.1 NAD(P)-dependent oxidoreductase [Actinotalea sp. M2MS4P-6]